MAQAATNAAWEASLRRSNPSPARSQRSPGRLRRSPSRTQRSPLRSSPDAAAMDSRLRSLLAGGRPTVDDILAAVGTPRRPGAGKSDSVPVGILSSPALVDGRPQGPPPPAAADVQAGHVIATLRHELEKKTAENDRLRHDLEYKARENDTRAQSALAMDAIVGALRQELEKKSAENEKLRQDLEQKVIENDARSHGAVAMDAILAAMRQELEKKAAENDRLKHELDKKCIENDALLAQIMEDEAALLRQRERAGIVAASAAASGPDTPSGASTGAMAASGADAELDTALFGAAAAAPTATGAAGAAGATGLGGAGGALPLPSLHVPSARPRQLGASRTAGGAPSASPAPGGGAASVLAGSGPVTEATEVAQLRAALARLAAERDQVVAELENHQRVTADLRVLLTSNQQVVAQVRAELARHASCVDRAELEARLAEAERARELAVVERTRLQAEAKACAAQLASVMAERDALAAEREELRRVNSDLQQLADQAQQTAARLQHDLVGAEQRVVALQEELSSKTVLLAQMHDAESRIVENNTTLLSENASLYGQLRSISSISAELESVLASPARRASLGAARSAAL